MYLVLTSSLLFTQKPGVDEGWFASPGWNLATKGYMGTSAVQEATFEGGRDLTGINHRTYWIMPLQLVGEAGWFKLVGFGLVQLRAWPVMWGLVALYCWWQIARSLLEDAFPAILATGLIAVDYTFVRVAAQGRMDMMCSALGLAGVALYLRYRESRLKLAVFVSHAALAAAIFTHPNGILYLFAVLVCTATLDLRRLRPAHLSMAAIPYLVGCAAWGLYILQAPDLFRRQFAGNAAGRLSALFSPWEALQSEIRERYLGLGAGSQHLLKIVSVLPYVLGLAGAPAIGPVRRNPRTRILILWAVGCFVYFWLFESTRLFLYVVHIAPICLVLLVACGDWLVRQRALVPRWVAVAGLAAFLAIQIGGCWLVARRNNMASYVAATRFLEGHVTHGELVMASSEFGIPLGYPDNLIDDQRLGYQTGKRPEYIVLTDRYTEWFDWAAKHEPDTNAYIRRTLSQDYHVVFQQGGISVSRRN
jgi:hypothetical protein